MPNTIKVLLIDDEVNQSALLRKVLQKKGLNVVEENNSVKAKELIEIDFFDLIVSDLQMPEVSGMDLLKFKPKDSLFIMITGYGSVLTAVESMKFGAYDYVNKPFNLEEFILKIDKAVEKIKITRELNGFRNLVSDREPFPGIIGTSKRMLEVYDFIEKTSKINVNVLIHGQSGTGKELVARALHYSSDRRNHSFVAINCSAIPENLLESELFGHSKGAFTGAIENQKGVFEQAHLGTLFLDEIAEMPFQLQAKLLRVLENWEFKPIGSDKVKKVDVRLISATNQNIQEMIAEKRFREDLFYRISTISLNLPTLNDRLSDIPALTFYILKNVSKKFGKELKISSDAISLLSKHNYKGNIRELENILEQAAVSAANNRIDVKNLSISEDNNFLDDCLSNAHGMSLKDLERKYIIKVLELTKGNKKKAAEKLGINRKTLYNKLSDFGIVFLKE